MSNECITTELGFEILNAADANQMRLLQGGPVALVSLIKALIWSTTSRPSDLIDEVCAIAGEHIEGTVETLIDEGENIHWGRDATGRLYLLAADLTAKGSRKTGELENWPGHAA